VRRAGGSAELSVSAPSGAMRAEPVAGRTLLVREVVISDNESPFWQL
jgi:hypothetical protein